MMVFRLIYFIFGLIGGIGFLGVMGSLMFLGPNRPISPDLEMGYTIPFNISNHGDNKIVYISSFDSNLFTIFIGMFVLGFIGSGICTLAKKDFDNINKGPSPDKQWKL